MELLVQKLRTCVAKDAEDPAFVHHDWFIKYHLEIVEKIALELCSVHEEADRDLVSALVWIHDYGKIVDFADQCKATLTEGKRLLLELGFPSKFVEKAISYAEWIDRKMDVDLRKAPIEVQIVSSADGASHLVGPFYYMWWHEHACKGYEQLMKDNMRKAMQDWDRKVVLPEVRKAFANRHSFLLEQNGKMPAKFLA